MAKGLDQIVLRRDEDGRLWAEVRGNLAGLLNLEETKVVASVGAGRGILTLATTPPEDLIVG